MKERLTRVAIYNRVSTDGQEKDGSSLETQQAACTAYAKERGWDIVQVVRETGSGATLDGRPKLSNLRSLIRSGAVDVLLVYALDRLSRDSDHRGVLRYELGQVGATLDSVTEELSNSFESKLFESVSGIIAEIERDKIRERTSRGIRARVEGTKDGTKRPIAGKKPIYGYAWADDRKSKLLEDSDTAEIVRRIFQETAAGVPMKALADQLTADGIPTPTGDLKPWSQPTIGLLLDQTAYIGEMRSYRNRVETSKKLNKNRRPTRTIARRPLSETILIEGAAPPLVDRSLFQRAQDQRAQRASFTSTRRNREEEALLRGGYLRCAHCGGPMTTAVHHGKVIYRCGQKFRKLTECPATSVRAEVIDPMIWALVKRVVDHPLQIELDAERLKVDAAPIAEQQRIEKRISDMESRRSNLRRSIARAKTDDAVDQLTDDLDMLTTELHSLQAELDALNGSLHGVGPIAAGLDPDALIAAWVDRLEQLREQVRPAAYDYQAKRQLLTSLGVSATIHRTFRTPKNLQEAGIMLADPPYTVSARIALKEEGPWPELDPVSVRSGVLRQCTPTSCWRCRRFRRWFWGCVRTTRGGGRACRRRPSLWWSWFCPGGAARGRCTSRRNSW
jgi:site-specific DNA recombinase